MRLLNAFLVTILLLCLLGFTAVRKTPSAIPHNLQSETTSYFPLEIKNIAAASGNNTTTYVLFTAKSIANPVVSCTVQFDYRDGAYFGSLVPLTATSSPEDLSILLDTLRGYAGDSTVLFMLPTLQSGRAMVSINNPLCMSTIQDSTGYVFQAPNIQNTSDPNYDYIFDKFEYTYDSSGQFYINPTAVDFYSIPIHIEILNDTVNAGSPLGFTRTILMDSIQGVLSTLDLTTDSSWSKCIIQDPTAGELLRIASPSLAPGFNPDYLTEPTGFNYVDQLISYYQSDTLTIDCTQLNVAGDQIYDTYKKTPAQDSGAYFFSGTINADSIWVFVNAPDSGGVITLNIDMTEVTSENFFGPGTGQFATPNKTVQSIVVENITAAFSVGLLPAPNNDTFSNTWFPTQMAHFFKSNPLNGPDSTTTGPWYDLYSQAVHVACGNKIYAFAYDDVLGQDGTLQATNTDTIRVTIGDLGDITVPVQSCLPPVLPIDASTVTVSTMDSGANEMSTITATWTVPPGQPDNAHYFLLFSSGKFVVTPDSIISNQLQAGPLPAYNATSATLCFNTGDWLGANTGTDIDIQVFTCGGSSTPCPTMNSLDNYQKDLGAAAVAQSTPAVDPKGCL